MYSHQSPLISYHLGNLHRSHLVNLEKNVNASFNLPNILCFRPIQYRDEVNSWSLFVPFPDGDVMERTQRYAFQKEKRKPVQTRVYCQFPNLFVIVALCIGSFFFALLAQFKFGVRLLERVSAYPCELANFMFTEVI